MDLHTWLDEEEGRATTLAKVMGVSKAAVSLWREGGVPLIHMDRVSAHTGGAVRVSAMVDHAIACRQGRAAKVPA